MTEHERDNHMNPGGEAGMRLLCTSMVHDFHIHGQFSGGKQHSEKNTQTH